MFYFETIEMMVELSFPLQLTIKYIPIKDLLMLYRIL